MGTPIQLPPQHAQILDDIWQRLCRIAGMPDHGMAWSLYDQINMHPQLQVDANGKQIYQNYSDVSSTPGNVTCHAVAGRAAISSGTQTCVVTNNRVTANSIVKVQLETAGGGVVHVVPTSISAGSFTVTSLGSTGAAANTSATVKFSFIVSN